jgi:hypothetical protein
MTILPPPPDDNQATPTAGSFVSDGLRLAIAHALAEQARAAFNARDGCLFEGAIRALVELASGSGGGRS